MAIKPPDSGIIMGVDPGTALTGYALLRVGRPKSILLEMGVIDLRPYEDHALKLKHIYEAMQRLISHYNPGVMAIEAPFYAQNAQAMLKLGRAQGVAMAAAMVRGLPVYEYPPLSVKQAVTGNGRATKEQVKAMLPHLIEGQLSVPYLDASDALAIAICHSLRSSGIAVPTQNSRPKARKGGGWSAFLKANPDREALP